MKELISCTEKSKIFIEVLDELELFIEKFFSSARRQLSAVRRAICRLSANFVIHITFFLST
jgi:hypothetical protein